MKQNIFVNSIHSQQIYSISTIQRVCNHYAIVLDVKNEFKIN